MAYNEYSTRFFFRFESNAGREFRIDIKKRNYTGVAEQRHLGQTPVLKRENGNSGIYGTSLEIYAECRIDGEFAELYTSDAKEFLVVLSEVSNGATTAIWHGFNTPELYAEPEVAPPYDVQIIATDGLGELKLYNFQPAGRQTLFYFIQNLLQYSGLVVSQSDVIVVDSLACVTPSVTAPNLLTGIQVDLDYLAAEGKSCYDVLSSLLTTLNLTLTRYADKWLLVRESDIEIDGGFVYGRTVSGTEVTLPVAQYGSMRNHRWYPVGRIDTDIEPAKNSLTVALPFKMRESMLNNPNLPDGTGWTYPTREQDPGGYVSWALFANDERRPYLWMVSQDVYIYQDIPVEQYAGMLTLALLTWDFTLQGARPNQYRVHYRIKLTSGNTTYWLKVDDNSTTWETSEKTNSYKCQRAILAEHQSSDTVSVNSFDRTEIQIPGIPASGTLRVEIIGKAKLVSLYADSFAVGGVFLTQDTVPGYKDEIAINNGARGSLSEIGVDFGDAPYAPNALTNLQNILTGGASTLTSDWKTSRFTGELLSVISMDYALSVALPRLKAHGTVNVPANADLPVAFINPSDIPMLIMTSSWKILTDDLDIELISCPAAEISILSQNIREMSKEEATSVGGSTAAAGSGGGSSVVPTQPQYFVPIEEEDSDEIESIKALYDISIIQQEADEEQGIEEVIKNISEILRHLFLVNNNGTLYLRSDISFYSDYAVSAGGISDTGGGGGGGIDADAMWRLLADSTNEQINASHLTNALDQYASKAWVEAQGYIRAEDIPGIVDPLAITTALAAASTRLDSLEEWTNRPYIEELATDVINTRRLVFDGQAINYIATDEDILDLAVQQAGHDARLEALESWIASPYAAEMTAAALHVERSIDLGGLTLDYDYANNAWHVHGNLYSDGFISAGGMSPVISSGGIDANAMWALLADTTGEPIAASHLPLSVSLSEGNYVQGISYANGIFTVVRATLPDSMKNPAALNFGSKSYDGSTAVSLTASDLGAITYVRNFGQTLTRGTTKTIATVGSTDITVTVPNFAFASDIPTLLPNPYALTFGSKTYDGSAARTITASDLGALTTHQRIYSLRIYNSAGSSVLYYIPTYGDETLTLTKAMVGLGNVDNTALSTWSGSSYITTLGTITSGTWNGSAIANSYLANSSITLAGRSVSLGGSISKGTMLSDLGLSSATSDISTLFGYFTNGVANSAARLSGTASKTAWGQTFWSSGTPDSVSGAMSSVTNINALLYFYNSDTRLGIGTSRPAYALDVAGSIQASSDIIAGGYIYIGGTSAYIRYVSTNAGLNVNVGLYSNSYISAGGLSSSSDRRLKTDIRSIDDRRAWSVISKLRPVEFRWITTGEQCSGLIAQEVEPYLPEAVTEVGGIKRLRYDVVFTYGLAALNSLRLQASSTQRRIDTLERRVRTLEQELRINNKS